MKTLILAALAATTIGSAAHAQGYYGDQTRYAPAYGYTTQVAYGDADRMYSRVVRHIDHGLRDGTIERYRAADYRRQADLIRQHAWYSRQRGVYDPGEVASRYNTLLARVDNDGRDQRYGYNGDRDGQYGYNRDGERDRNWDNRDTYRDPSYPRW